MPKLNRHAASFVLLPTKSANSFLLHNQLLRCIAEHDGVNTFWQVAEVYSQSLDAGFEIERSYPSSVDVEDLKQSVLL